MQKNVGMKNDVSSAGRAPAGIGHPIGGAKFIRQFARDNSSHSLPDTKGGKMGGSVNNLAHSLGSSVNQKGPR
jgi:hypothetical protein